MVDLQQLRFIGLGMIPKAGTDMIAAAADELQDLRAAADEVLRTYMPQFPDSRAVDDCLVALAAARSGIPTPAVEAKLDRDSEPVYVRCVNWPCVLPHNHKGPCTSSDSNKGDGP